MPVSCYANNLYCYINGELQGDKPINIKNIASKILRKWYAEGWICSFS